MKLLDDGAQVRFVAALLPCAALHERADARNLRVGVDLIETSEDRVIGGKIDDLPIGEHLTQLALEVRPFVGTVEVVEGERAAGGGDGGGLGIGEAAGDGLLGGDEAGDGLGELLRRERVRPDMRELLAARTVGMGDDREARAALLSAICDATGAQPVQTIGKILVIYRPLPPEAKKQVKKRPGRKPLRSSTPVLRPSAMPRYMGLRVSR